MKFAQLFPTPKFIMPTTVGIDFSDTALRFLSLEKKGDILLPASFKEIPLNPGVVVGGRVKDTAAFSAVLQNVKDTHGIEFVKVSIPESQLYLSTIAIDKADAHHMSQAIELVLEDHIPLTLNEAVFDFSVLKEEQDKIIVQVVAAPIAIIQELHDILSGVGLIPLAFELEGQAVARAIFSNPNEGSRMIVDFGAARTTITVVTGGISVFTSTLEFGGAHLTTMLAKELNVSLEDAETLKRTYGLQAMGERQDIFEVISGGVGTLKDEINRRYVFWHEQNDQNFHFPRIQDIVICGGYSNLPGLADYLSASLKLQVSQASPWKNCFSTDDTIPSIDKERAMSFITCIGLCLSDYE
ncbi:MAG: pilus assembly protein PilM [bacterium]